MTSKKRKALAALISSPTIRQAAANSGVGYATLREWLRNDEEFINAYKAATAQIVDDAVFEARQSLSLGLSALRRIAEDERQNGAVVAQASRALLEFGLKLSERADILDRLAAIEKQIKDDKV